MGGRERDGERSKCVPELQLYPSTYPTHFIVELHLLLGYFPILMKAFAVVSLHPSIEEDCIPLCIYNEQQTLQFLLISLCLRIWQFSCKNRWRPAFINGCQWRFMCVDSQNQNHWIPGEDEYNFLAFPWQTFPRHDIHSLLNTMSFAKLPLRTNYMTRHDYTREMKNDIQNPLIL